jgi:Transposase DDE domain group 1
LVGLLRQSVFGRLAGYEDVNDADRLCHDPAMRRVIGDRAITGCAASASQMGRFETKWLSRPENLAALAELPGQWIDKVHQRRPPRTIVLDMDSSESPTYGEQEGSAYNGHFGCTCYHPLFVFNQLGDVERCALSPGNVHSADGQRWASSSCLTTRSAAPRTQTLCCSTSCLPLMQPQRKLAAGTARRSNVPSVFRGACVKSSILSEQGRPTGE